MNARPWTKWFLRGLCSLGLIALLLGRVRWHELAALLRQADPLPLALGVLCVGLGPALIAARTRLMLAQNRVALPYPRVLSLTWLGQFCNTFLPGSTGGDAVKFLRLCRWVPGRKADTLAALVADRLLALVALMTLAGLALACGEGQIRRQLLAGVSGRLTPPLFLAGVCLLAGGCAGLWWGWRRYFARFEGLAARVRPVAGSLRAGFRPTPALAAAFGLALVLQLLSMASGWLFCRALQIPAGFGQMMVLVPLVLMATLLPLTVNGHGLREYVLLFYFQAWHLASTLPGGGGRTESVVALSLLMVMADFFWSLPGGLCLLADAESTPAARRPGEVPASAKLACGQ